MYFLNFALCIISQENNITHCLASVCVFSSDPFTPNEGSHTTFLFLTKRNNTKKGKNGTLSVKRLLGLANPIVYMLKWPTVCGGGGEHSGPLLLLLLWFPNNCNPSVLWRISTLPGQHTLGKWWWMIRTVMVITVIMATGVTEATDFRLLRRKNSC